MDAKYGFIHGALQEAGYQTGNKKDTYQLTHLIDQIITNRYVGFPIFILMIWIMFEATFSLGQYPMGWIESGVEWIGTTIAGTMPSGPLKDMLIDGVIGDCLLATNLDTLLLHIFHGRQWIHGSCCFHHG